MMVSKVNVAENFEERNNSIEQIESLNPAVSLVSDAATFNHIPGGANCLYLDGHVEFLRFATDFPCTRAAAVMIGSV